MLVGLWFFLYWKKIPLFFSQNLSITQKTSPVLNFGWEQKEKTRIFFDYAKKLPRIKTLLICLSLSIPFANLKLDSSESEIRDQDQALCQSQIEIDIKFDVGLAKPFASGFGGGLVSGLCCDRERAVVVVGLSPPLDLSFILLLSLLSPSLCLSGETLSPIPSLTVSPPLPHPPSPYVDAATITPSTLSLFSFSHTMVGSQMEKHKNGEEAGEEREK